MEQLNQLSSWIEQSKKGIKTVKEIAQIDSDTIAAKTLLGIESLLIQPQPLTNVAGKIGSGIVEGYELEFFDEDTPEATIEEYRIKVGLHVLRILFDKKLFFPRFVENKGDENSTNKGRGRYMILEEKVLTTRIKRYRVSSGAIISKSVSEYVSTDFIEALRDFLPIGMIATHKNISFNKPLERTSFYDTDGGKLVKKLSNERAKNYTEKVIPKLYKAINILQQTAYRVNLQVLEVINAELPTLQQEIRNTSLSLDKKIGLLRELNMVVDIVNAIGDRVFYQYHYLDFRGRIYPSGAYFNHCASKLAKSLFLFADAGEVNTEAKFWLKVHTANVFGEDKLTLDGRVEFVEDHYDEFVEIGRNPLTDKRWKEADAPYEFLAACIELANIEDGATTSALPIAFDATCSGLQVFSALSRDADTGALCNLTNSGVVGDYYMAIADLIWDNMDKSNFWYQFKDKRRALVKRSSMVFLYSCGKTQMGIHCYADSSNPLNKKLYCDGITQEDANWLGAACYDACKELMPKTAKLMELFQQLGKKFAANNEEMKVRAPYSNFLMEQSTRENTTGRVKWKYNKKEYKFRYVNGKKNYIPVRAVITGASPNSIHTLDATIPCMLANVATYPLMVQHDSFATTPANAGKLFEDVRECFVELFGGNVLEQIFEEAGALELLDGLEYGTLNIEEVLENEWFCS